MYLNRLQEAEWPRWQDNSPVPNSDSAEILPLHAAAGVAFGQRLDFFERDPVVIA